MARPRKKIDPEQVRRLASIHCTVDEMASVIGCSKRTLERRFAAVIEKGRDEGRASLRRLQWQTANGGVVFEKVTQHRDGSVTRVSMPAYAPNPTMQIWLGKQLLAQKDRSDVTSGDQPLPAAATGLPPGRLTPEEVRAEVQRILNGELHDD